MAEPVRNTKRRPRAPLRPVRLGGGADVDARPQAPTARSILRSPHPARRLSRQASRERLEHWAKAAPDRIFLAAARRPTAPGASSPTRRRWRRCAASAQALLERDLSPERPIAILSGNDIEHALLGLAAMYAGIPYAPISPAYSLMSSDFGKLQIDHRRC